MMKQTSHEVSPRRYSPLGQIVLARLREFYREPEALFWVYGFPILMVVGLGIAFRNQPIEKITVDVEAGSLAEGAVEALAGQERFVAAVRSPEEARLRLRTGKSDLVVTARGGSPPKYDFLFDRTRPASVVASEAVDNALERAAGRQDVVQVSEQEFTEPGGRYIDFLVPGLLGMSLMGGGLWGVGFVTVDMRIRKLLKRFLATPMRKTDFLAGIMLSRLLFMVPEVLVLLIFARYAFDVRIFGSVTAVVFLILLGAAMFSGLGLLVASRAKTLEAVSGLMNLVMLPMWMLSGIFFSSERFPEAAQPLIKLLPLTALNDSLRAVMQDGATLASQWSPIALMFAWAVVTFVLALRWFRWS
jgi:ABC-type multidrug transport system permease subunit